MVSDDISSTWFSVSLPCSIPRSCKGVAATQGDRNQRSEQNALSAAVCGMITVRTPHRGSHKVSSTGYCLFSKKSHRMLFIGRKKGGLRPTEGFIRGWPFIPALSHQWDYFNPLDSKGNYSATSNNTKLVHLPLMAGLLPLVQRGGAWAGYGPVQSPPRCTKCNSPTINGKCTNHCIAIWCSVALRF